MKTIWKAEIDLSCGKDEATPITVKAPEGSTPVSVGVQGGRHGQICVWFETDPDAPPGEFTLYCLGTGFGRVPEGRKFFATIQCSEYVWHLYV